MFVFPTSYVISNEISTVAFVVNHAGMSVFSVFSRRRVSSVLRGRVGTGLPALLVQIITRGGLRRIYVPIVFT